MLISETTSVEVATIGWRNKTVTTIGTVIADWTNGIALDINHNRNHGHPRYVIKLAVVATKLPAGISMAELAIETRKKCHVFCVSGDKN